MPGTSNISQLPTPQDVEIAKSSSRTLSKYSDAERVQLSINGSNNETDELILPGHAMQLLLEVLSEMSQGNAIGILPIHAELTTQDAANFLNISRPFLIKLLDEKAIPFHMIGTHRRIYAEDVFDYKDRIDAERKRTLDELASKSQELGMGYD